jgi:cytochrome P450
MTDRFNTTWVQDAESAAGLVEGGPPLGEMTQLVTFAEVDEAFRSRDFEQARGARDSAPFTLHTLLSLSGEDHFSRRRLEAGFFNKGAIAS